MNKYLKYTKDGIEVDLSEAMHYGDKKKEESKGAPDVSKHYFKSKDEAMKDAEKMGLKGVHSHKGEKGETLYMAGPNHAAFMKKHKEILNKPAKAGHYGDKKKSKAEMSPKQKGGLDKNKDGKISKEDFEMLRKEKKESKSMDKDKDKDKKKIKPKMSYAEVLIDLTEKFGLSEKPSLADFKKPTKED